jgi:hypothetical protein
MNANPPSGAQNAYLKRLGYKGEWPRTKSQASATIDEMLESHDSKKAERAMLRRRKEEAKEEAKDRKEWRKQRLADAKEEIRDTIRENKRNGCGFAGYRYVPMGDYAIREEDMPYLDAVIFLDVAAKYPELLARDTLEVDLIDDATDLPIGTRVVVGPDEFKAVKQKGFWPFQTVCVG